MARISFRNRNLRMVIAIAGFLIFFAGPVSSVRSADEGSDFFVSKVEISPRVHSLNPCEEKKFGVTVKNKLGKTIKDAKVTWGTTDPKVATVKEDGTVVGVDPGYTFIFAQDGNVKSNMASVFVRDKGTRRC